VKYKDPILSNQQAASATQLLQNDGSSKSKYLCSIKYIIRYKKNIQVKIEIHQFITELNCKNNMVTPFLHTYVHKKKGGKIKYMFSMLIDGLHPTIDLSVILTIQFSDELIYLSQNTMESVLHFIIILIKFQDICLIYRVCMKIPLTKTRCSDSSENNFIVLFLVVINKN
jgi:hypothetical protein